MLKIKKEMIDEAVEREKKNRAKSEKATVKAAVFLLIIIFLELFLLAGFLSVNITKTLPAAAVFIIADIVFFFAAVEVIMRIDTSEPPYPAVFSFYYAYMHKRFTARLDAAPTVEKKLRLYEENFKKAVVKHRKVLAAVEYIKFLIKTQGDKNSDILDELYEEIANDKPKKILLKFTRLQGLLDYYIFTEDPAGYIRTFEENSDTISKFWDSTFLFRTNIFMCYVQYFEYKNDFQNALEYYDLLVYFNEKAFEIDVSLALPDEAVKAFPLDYSGIFCKLGRLEDAEKYFREAEELLADSNDPRIKDQMETIRKMLDEANIAQKESDTND
ncbi:MAG: hypothetical protein K2J11_01700 [Oscillospiraceae bacterium]|nr:hypothetical protein [Oscillospiraceae bacterium]